MELVPERTLRLKSLEGIKKKDSWFFIFIAVVLIANILVLIAVFRRYDFFYWLKSSPSELEHAHLSYGESPPQFFGRTLGGSSWHSDSLRGKWGLVFYFRRHFPSEFLFYGDMLNRKYETRGLYLVGITQQVSDDLKRLIQRLPLSFPILVDGDNRVRDRLRWTHHEYGLLLVDPQGKIEFSLTRLLTKSDLRQLVEKYLLGGIRYGDEEPRVKVKPGQRLPPYRLMDVRSGKNLTLRDLDLAEGTIVFFTASCSLCNVSRYFDQLRAIEGERKGSGPYHFIFSHTFWAAEVERLVREREIASAVYLAMEPFDLLESSEATAGRSEEDAVVITMTSDGRVRAIESLLDWLAGV